MLHLSSDRLASLADGEPSAAEAMHLAGCDMCLGERLAYQELVLSARRTRERDDQPLTDWNTLSLQLRAEGLLREEQPVAAAPRWLRRVGALAASFALLAGGTAFGRVSAGAALLPGAPVAQAPETDPESAQTIVFTSTSEALEAMLRSQRVHQAASTYLASQQQDADTRENYYTRLAALDLINTASLAALREDPTDPVMNGYYTSTLGWRDATVRQINGVIPVGSLIRK